MNELSVKSVEELLSKIKYPGFSRDIVSFGVVSQIRVEDSEVVISLKFTTQNEETRMQVKKEITETLTSDFPRVQVKIEEVPAGAAKQCWKEYNKDKATKSQKEIEEKIELKKPEGDLIDMKELDKLTKAELEQAIQSLTDLIKKDSGKRKIRCTSCSWVGLSSELAKSTKCPTCGGSCVLVDDEGQVIIDVGGLEMKEQIEKLEQEIAKLKEEIAKRDAELATKDETLQKVNETVEALKKESEEAKQKIEKIEQEITEKVEKAKSDAKTISDRRNELGDVAKDVKDEELLSDATYSNLKLKKQLAEKDDEIARLKENKGADLDKGATRKEAKDEGFDAQDRVQKSAWKD